MVAKRKQQDIAKPALLKCVSFSIYVLLYFFSAWNSSLKAVYALVFFGDFVPAQYREAYKTRRFYDADGCKVHGNPMVGEHIHLVTVPYPRTSTIFGLLPISVEQRRKSWFRYGKRMMTSTSPSGLC